MPRIADPNTKIDLLRAAQTTFAEHGLVDAKVSDITTRAGVSKGAFYLHFASKEDCFKQIVEAFLARLAACLDPAPLSLEDGPQTIEERLARWHEHDVTVFEFCWENRALLRMILEGSSGSSYAYLVDELAERVKRLTQEWIRHAIDAGHYRADVDPVVVSALVSGAYDRLARELIRTLHKPDITAWCRQTLDLLTRGLMTNDARAVLDQGVNHRAETKKTASPKRPKARSKR